jgi:hypothetical protein
MEGYFFIGITVLVIANLYAIARINRKSYLYAPISLPRFGRGGRDTTSPNHEKTVELSPTQRRMHDYVERFAERQMKAIEERNEAAAAESAAWKYTPDQEERSESQEPLVGVAVLQSRRPNPVKRKAESNIDRWYRQAVGA